MDAGVHRIYMATKLGGKVAQVSAVMDRPRSEDSFVLTLTFESGAIGVIQGAYNGPEGIFDDRIEVHASNGMAEVLGCEAYFEGDLSGDTMVRARIEGEWVEYPVEDSWDASVMRSVAGILASFAVGEEAEVGPGEGREAVAIIEAAYRSAEEGRTISMEEM
jgi:predicted dehydrogenase